MKKSIKYLVILFSILIVTSCGETVDKINNSGLTNEDMQAAVYSANQFNAVLRQTSTINFIKTCMQQTDKTSYMMDYLSPVLASNQTETAAKLLRLLFSSETNNARSSAENDLFRSSPAVTALTGELTGELKNALILFKNELQSKEELISNLKSVLTNFKIAVNENKSLTFDEARALLAAAEFESNSITEVVNMAIGLDTNINGRTEGWFSNLIQAVVTAVVAVVVVVAVVATGGAAAIALGITISASSFATAIAVGAVVGGVYGGVVGYDNANRGKYFTGFNPENIGGGFLDWEPCYQNSIGWACI